MYFLLAIIDIASHINIVSVITDGSVKFVCLKLERKRNFIHASICYLTYENIILKFSVLRNIDVTHIFVYF